MTCPTRTCPASTGAAALTALTDLGLASIAAGAIARRRPVIRLLERTKADARGVARMRALRKEFGSGPVEIVIPGRRILVILDPDDVGRVLAESPNPFDPANNCGKRQALQQFQPHGVLISTGRVRDVAVRSTRKRWTRRSRCTDSPNPSRGRSKPRQPNWPPRHFSAAASIRPPS